MKPLSSFFPSPSSPMPIESDATCTTTLRGPAGTSHVAGSASPPATSTALSVTTETCHSLSAVWPVVTVHPLFSPMRVRFSTAIPLSTMVSTVPAPPSAPSALSVLTTGMGHASPRASTTSLFSAIYSPLGHLGTCSLCSLGR